MRKPRSISSHQGICMSNIARPPSIRRGGVDAVAQRLGELPVSTGHEFMWVVAAQDVDFRAVFAFQFAQSMLILQPGITVLFHHPLVKAQSARATRFLEIHFAVEKIGVARKECPFLGALHSDAAMSMGMANQGH